MLLAGLLLKVGVFGVLKVVVLNKFSLLPLTIIAAMGCVFGGLLARLSRETKVLTAYSSITHLNFGLYGVNLCSSRLLESRYVLCLGHGYIRTIIFYLVGSLYHYSGTRVLYYALGLSSITGLIYILVFISYLVNAGIPPFLPF